MSIFDWFIAKPPTNIEAAIRVLSSQSVCKEFNVVSKKHSHFMVGEIIQSGLLGEFFGRKPKAFFRHYNVKFSNDGEKAMISSNGSVDFFFSDKHEVDQIKELLFNKFGVRCE